MLPKTKLMILILLTMLTLAGCWNYREIDQLSIVAGMALDKDPKTGEYLLAVELVKPGQGPQQGQIQPEVMQITGGATFDAARNYIEITGKKLYWPHTKVFIVSEEIAREEMLGAIDWLLRDAEIRSNVYLIVSKEKTAKEILQTKVKTENTISYMLRDSFKASGSIHKYPPVELWEFSQILSAEGISPVLPTVNIMSLYQQKIPQVNGAAIFKKEKAVGFLHGEETRHLLMIKDQIKGGFVTKHRVNINEKPVDMALEIFNSKTSVKPVLTPEGQLVMKIDVDIDLGVAQLYSYLNATNPITQQLIEKSFAEKTKRSMSQVIAKAQGHRTDIFGFGQTINIQKPGLWQQLKPQWENMFAELETDITVNAQMVASGLVKRAIKMED